MNPTQWGTKLKTWNDRDGRQRSKSFRLRRDAESFKKLVEAQEYLGLRVSPKAERQLFTEWTAQFMDQRTGRNGSPLPPATLERAASALKVNILPYFGSMQLGSIERRDVQEWVGKMIAKGLAPGTIRREFGVLVRVFNEAVDDDQIRKSPCRKIALPSPESSEQRFLSPSEVEALTEAMHPRYKTLVLTGCYAGLRPGELAGLKSNQVLFDRRQIHVLEGLVETSAGVTIGRLKTKYSRGLVDIPDFLIVELSNHLRSFPPSPEGLVFPSPDGKPLRPRNWRRRYWDEAVRVAGLDLPCPPKSMRHTFVSILIQQGLSIEKVCEQARHRDPGFTWRTYRHRFEEAVSRSGEALQRARTSARLEWEGMKEAQAIGDSNVVELRSRRPNS